MYKETELYKHAKNELDMLVELEREDNLNTPIGILDTQWEERGGLTSQELINNIILDIISSIDSTKLDRVSLNYIADVLNRLLNFQNLSPLSLIPAEFEGKFKFAKIRSKLAGTIRGSYFKIKQEYPL